MCSICGKSPCWGACPNADEIVATTCEECGCEIFVGDEYYKILGKYAVCIDCIDDARTTAEYAERDEEWFEYE